MTVTEPSSTEPVETVTVSAPATVEAAKIGPGAPTRRVEFGHIRSLKRSEDGYVLRFDPAEYLTGVTASDALQEDTGSSDVPNDNYVVDEGHRALYVQRAGRRARDGARRRRRRARRSRLPSSRRSSRAASRSGIRSSNRSRPAFGSFSRSTPCARSTSSTSLKKKLLIRCANSQGALSRRLPGATRASASPSRRRKPRPTSRPAWATLIGPRTRSGPGTR